MEASLCMRIVAIMLIELWERLRGYDKWTETQAKIESSNVEKTPVTDRSGRVAGYSYSSGDMLTWIDASGEKQYANFTVHDDSPLYQLIGGESVAIRYNPVDPAQYYFRELLRTRINRFFKVLLGVAAVVTFIALNVWVQVHFGGRRH
jgi:hypothetical protein